MKFSKNSYWLKSGIYTTAQRFSTIFLNFGGFYFLVRVSSKSEFGVWALFTTITSLIEVARNGLIRNAQVKFLSSEEEVNFPLINTASLALNIIFTVFTSLIVLVAAPLLSVLWNAPELEKMLYFSILTTFALIPSSQFEYLQHAKGDFRGVFLASFVRYSLIFLFIMITFFTTGKIDLLNLVNFQTAAAVVASIIAYISVRKYMDFSSKVDRKWFNKLFHYGKYTFGTNISSMLNKNIDQAMLGTMVSTASVATYAAALKISTLIEAPTLSVAAIVFPQSAKRMQTEGASSVKYLYEKSVGLLLAIIFPALVFVLIFPKFIILFIAGKEYLDTVPILQITILYSIFVPFGRQFGTVLDSIGRPQVNFYLVIAGAFLTALFNYLFISRYGVIGAAYGTLTTFIILFLINQFILSKLMDIKTVNTLHYARKFYVDGFRFVLIKLKLIKPMVEIKE